jgi:hypothetical protein
MAPLHGGSSAGKSDLCCGHSLDVVGRPGLHQSGLMSICFAGCLSPGPRKNDLTIYWALGPFVRSFTLLVDPGDIYPPQSSNSIESHRPSPRSTGFPLQAPLVRSPLSPLSSFRPKSCGPRSVRYTVAVVIQTRLSRSRKTLVPLGTITTARARAEGLCGLSKLTQLTMVHLKQALKRSN